MCCQAFVISCQVKKQGLNLQGPVVDNRRILRAHMKPPTWSALLLDRLLGRHPSVRRHTLFSLATGLFYAVSIGIAYHAASMNIHSKMVAHLLASAMVSVYLLFYVLVRSGWSQRFADPVLTLPHALISVLITVAAYVLIGPSRGNVVLLLGQTIAVSMFRLRPQQTLLLGVWTVAWLSLSQLGLVIYNAHDFSPARALAHFTVSTAGLLTLSLVAKWISDMRVRIARQANELRDTLTRAQALATTDTLTGLLNRRSMMEQLETELAMAARSARPLCVALIDIDHFKRINDQHGHRTGDEVLRTFASRAQEDLRQLDKLARWGGEEFLLLLPHADLAQAWVAIERLRLQLASEPMGAGGDLRVTLSAGVAQWQVGESLEYWLDRADKAMYEAKQQGRNRCVQAGVPGPQAAASALLPPVLQTQAVVTAGSS
jgi:diguanylate cyclase